MLINISDHHTRVKANSPPADSIKVLGCLLGSQSGRTVDICNSFEFRYEVTSDGIVVDQDFLI